MERALERVFGKGCYKDVRLGGLVQKCFAWGFKKRVFGGSGFGSSGPVA